MDPYGYVMRPEMSIPRSQKEWRDKVWAIIQPVVEALDGQMYPPRHRGPLVKEVAKRSGKTKVMIYRYLRKYWRGGQTKNSLLSDFDRRGDKGQERSVTHRKRGRPPKRILVEPEQIGVNVDAIIKEKLRRGAKLYYENAKARTLRDAYQLTLEHLFNREFERKGSLLVPVLPPISELPTLGQFRYWYEKEHDMESYVCRLTK